MFEALNERLSRAAEALARREKLQRKLAELEQEQRQAAETARKLSQRVAQLEHQVDGLEGMSLTNLFYSVLGSRDERLHQGRQEVVSAQLKLDEASRRAAALTADVDRARTELKAMPDPAAEHQQLLQAKEDLISRSAGEGARQLFSFGEREQQLKWQVQQLEEAETAGYTADGALAKVEDALNSARGWGTYDMLGGGMIATAVKHARMDEAQEHVHWAQQALAAFRRELKDVAMEIQVDTVRLDGFTRFADFFFDGLIVDWAVQNRINQSLQSVQRSRADVSHLIGLVHQRMNQARTDLQSLQQERTAFLEQFRG